MITIQMANINNYGDNDGDYNFINISFFANVPQANVPQAPVNITRPTTARRS